MCKVMKLTQEIDLWPCITLGSGALREGRHSYGFGMIQGMFYGVECSIDWGK